MDALVDRLHDKNLVLEMALFNAVHDLLREQYAPEIILRGILRDKVEEYTAKAQADVDKAKEANEAEEATDEES